MPGLDWNHCSVWIGIAARFGLESLPGLDWNRCPVWIGITARFGLESLPGLDWNMHLRVCIQLIKAAFCRNHLNLQGAGKLRCL